MTTAAEIAAFADSVLRTKEVPDYPAALNGLQIDTRAAVVKLAASVDFSARTAAAAIDAGAQLMIVHHGAFWQGSVAITGKRFELMAGLIERSLGVYASHIPLDCHPTIGNNVLLAKELELDPTSGFASLNGIRIGVAGESSASLETLVARAEKFSVKHGGRLRVTPHSPTRRIGRWAMCSGSGADSDTLKEALELGVNTLIVGEGPHWTSVFAEDNDIVVLYAGHYATETLGVQALASMLASQFKIGWEFIPAPTGS